MPASTAPWSAAGIWRAQRCCPVCGHAKRYMLPQVRLLPRPRFQTLGASIQGGLSPWTLCLLPQFVVKMWWSVIHKWRAIFALQKVRTMYDGITDSHLDGSGRCSSSAVLVRISRTAPPPEMKTVKLMPLYINKGHIFNWLWCRSWTDTI